MQVVAGSRRRWRRQKKGGQVWTVDEMAILCLVPLGGGRLLVIMQRQVLQSPTDPVFDVGVVPQLQFIDRVCFLVVNRDRYPQQFLDKVLQARVQWSCRGCFSAGCCEGFRKNFTCFCVARAVHTEILDIVSTSPLI